MRVVGFALGWLVGWLVVVGSLLCFFLSQLCNCKPTTVREACAWNEVWKVVTDGREGGPASGRTPRQWLPANST